MSLRPVLIEDDRTRLVDREFAGELYHAARDYFVLNEQTRLSDAWADPRITPVAQPIYDYYDDETGQTIASKMDFKLSVYGLRKRDGIHFCTNMVVPVELKRHWEVIREHCHMTRVSLEEFAECECNLKHKCDRHADSGVPEKKNEAVLRV